MLPINVGVSRGSELGPLLFINYLQSTIGHEISYFEFGKRLHNTQPQLTADIHTVIKWFKGTPKGFVMSERKLVYTVRVLKLAAKALVEKWHVSNASLGCEKQYQNIASIHIY